MTRVSSPSEIIGISDLQEMNLASPSIIAKDGDKVVGYALFATKDIRNGHDLGQKLYGHFRDCLSKKFTYLVTDIAQANVRSLKANKKRGFQVINKLMYDGVEWDIVLWDWNIAD